MEVKVLKVGGGGRHFYHSADQMRISISREDVRDSSVVVADDGQRCGSAIRDQADLLALVAAIYCDRKRICARPRIWEHRENIYVRGDIYAQRCRRSISVVKMDERHDGITICMPG